MSGEISLEEATKILPAALAAEDLRALYDELLRLDSGIRYYSPHEFQHFLQGDPFENAPLPIWASDEPKIRSTRVMLLSNTCDMFGGNSRQEPVFVSVAPLIRVSVWRAQFERAGLSVQRIQEKLEAARLHRISSVFLLKPGCGVDEESLVLFSQIQSIPFEKFQQARPTRLGVLSQAAFWLLTVKLSVHFCRMQESVNRQAA